MWASTMSFASDCCKEKQEKQEDVEANDGWEKNEEKEKVCCNYGSVWSDGCYLSAERCADGDSGTRRGGTVAWKASGKQTVSKISGMTRATFGFCLWFLSAQNYNECKMAFIMNSSTGCIPLETEVTFKKKKTHNNQKNKRCVSDFEPPTKTVQIWFK